MDCWFFIVFKSFNLVLSKEGGVVMLLLSYLGVMLKFALEIELFLSKTLSCHLLASFKKCISGTREIVTVPKTLEHTGDPQHCL